MKTNPTRRTYTSPEMSIVKLDHSLPLCGSQTSIGTESLTETGTYDGLWN